MDKPIHLVVFAQTFPKELREMFGVDVQKFQNGVFYMKASDMEFLGSFFRLDLILKNTQEPCTVWIRADHVLTVVSGRGKKLKFGFET